MRELGTKALFFVLALPALARATLRLSWLERRYRLDDLAERLRRTRPFRLAFLRHPRYLAGSVDRLLGPGHCLRRSLLLLDLWSRCGLEPELRLGVLKALEERQFHAWVTVSGEHLEVPPPHLELWCG